MTINGFWVITESGLCLFASRWNELEMSDNIFSGFLSAVHSFTQSTGLTPVQQTETEKMRIVYSYRSNLMFIMATTKDMEDKICHNYLLELQDKFFRQYESLVWTAFIKKAISENTFYSFQEIIDDILIMNKPPPKESKDSVKDKSKSDLKSAFSKLVQK